MKKLKYLTLAFSAVIALGSCKKYLDVNQNPNDATEATPELVLPNALVATAAATVTFNEYGSWQVGMSANAGGFGGFGSLLTYDYPQTQYNGLWNSSYDNLYDYQYIINQTAGSDEYAHFNAVARIMRAFVYQRLVDEYNDIPYSEALQGVANTTPAYDNAEDIYRDLYAQLDLAIETIDNAVAPLGFTNVLVKSDVMFDGNMTRWKQFANTLKLKLLIRASGTSVFSGVTPTFDPVGFITEDVLVNPGYIKADGKQNPMWATFHSDAAGNQATAGRSRIPTIFAISFYNGNKLVDPKRALAIYRGGTNPVRNQLGITDDNVPLAPTGSPVWYSGNGATYSYGEDPINAVGVLKGRNAGMPLMLAAESYFLQSEGRMRGIITSGASVEELFDDGIEASFTYLYKNSSGVVAANPLGLINPSADADAYQTANASSYLANIDLASSDEQRLEAIITQKYIALNFIHGHEAWAEFRRTGYPQIVVGSSVASENFASTLTTATTPDELPGRLLYPTTEFQLNPENVPQGITVFGSYVFWDRRN
jgi:hypothetical protein